MDNVKKAEELFTLGYNCAQATFGAFADEMGISLESAVKLSSSFGGGMGRMREVCGALSGIFMVAGAFYGYTDPKADTEKAEHYKRIRDLAESFKAENGSIICKELLGEGAQVGGTPEKRTNGYYKARPCVECVKSAAAIMQKYINENGRQTSLDK